MLRTADLEYELPEASIATAPATPRDSARLLVLPPDGSPAMHRRVSDLPSVLRRGDLLVFNATRVLRARFVGHRADTGGKAEGLFLREAELPGGGVGWICLARLKRIAPGVEITVERKPGEVALRLLAVAPQTEEPGAWLFAPRQPEGAPVAEPAAEVLERAGLTPLPPYILRARTHQGLERPEDEDHDRYQTTFAKGQAGSVAAPTAGLHFTPELLESLAHAGVERAEVTLHVGTGTFRPVETEFVEDHPMHSEWCSMSAEAVEQVRRARAEGRRVIAVGTTSARTLESFAQAEERGELPESLATRILITPGYPWRWVDGLLTNFHLPRSTLMAMVASRISAEPGVGVAKLKELYAIALREGYRFYSFGDAMLIQPRRG